MRTLKADVIIDILFCAWLFLVSYLYYYFVIISYQYLETIPSVVRIIQIELFAIDKLSYWDIVRIIRWVDYSSFLPGIEFERENWELHNRTEIFKI